MEVRDEQLLADYLRGDEKALEVLFARYLKPIYYLAYRYTGARDEAEDLTQETFVRVWRHRKKFKMSKNNADFAGGDFVRGDSVGASPVGGNFRAWIFTIAKNAALDWLKKKKTIPFSALAGAPSSATALTQRATSTSPTEIAGDADWGYFAQFLIDDQPRPDESYQQKELAASLNQATTQLPPEQQQVIAARHQRELSFKEIARELKLSLNTVKSRYWRALRRLKELLE